MRTIKILSTNGDKSSARFSLRLIMFIFFGSASFLFAEEADRSARETPTVKAVRKALPSVVNISTENASSGNSAHSLGSGSIIDASGLLVTNSHVASGVSLVTVKLLGGKSYTAREIANDEFNDLALLQIENLPPDARLNPIPLSAPGDLILGETVIAVGNPYGLGCSISKGVLSALGRKVVYKGRIIFSDIIQTDAAIYPGNSGGPLININGRMIGIATAVLKNAKGVGFAIPLLRIENTLAKWLLPERSNGASLGFLPSVRMANGGSKIYVSSVRKNSPAWNAGIRGGEDIASFDGKPLSSLMELGRKLWRLKAGDVISLGLADGKNCSIKLLKGARKDGAELAREKLGVSVEKLTPVLAKAMGYHFSGGFVVSEVAPDENLLTRGDVIVRLAGIPIHVVSDLAKALAHRSPGDQITAEVKIPPENASADFLKKKTIKLAIK